MAEKKSTKLTKNHYVKIFKGSTHFILTDWKLFQVSYTSGSTCHRCEFNDTLTMSLNHKACWERLFGISMGRSRRDKKVCPIKWIFNDPILQSYNLNAFILEDSKMIDLSKLRNSQEYGEGLSMYLKLYLSKLLGIHIEDSKNQVFKLEDIIKSYAKL